MHDKRNLAQLLVTKLSKVTNNKYTFYTQYQTDCSAQVSRPLVTQLLVLYLLLVLLLLLLLLLTEHVSPTTTTYSTTNTGAARAAVLSVGKVQVMRAVSTTTDAATTQKAFMFELRMMQMML